jgi:hypothetical protein
MYIFLSLIVVTTCLYGIRPSVAFIASLFFLALLLSGLSPCYLPFSGCVETVSYCMPKTFKVSNLISFMSWDSSVSE